MKIIRQLKSMLQFSGKKSQNIVSDRGFFEYSSREKIRILRLAARKAQIEQQQLLKSYDARFGIK